MKQDVFIFGEVLFDCFPDGREVLGGAPFNVAWHLQAFGQAPVFISRVGDDDAGRRIRRAMSDWGMGVEHVQVDPQHPTGRVVVSLAAGEPSYQIVADSAFDFIAPGALPSVRHSLLYHGSLALRCAASASALARLKSALGPRIFVDVNLRAPWWERDRVIGLLEGAAWVKLNREEFMLLGGEDGDVAVAAERFRTAYRLEGLVLTFGAQGAVAVTAGAEPVRISPAPVSRVVDAVGAGDAFASVMILGLRLRWPLPVTLQRAQEFASSVVQRRGATVADPSFYAPLRRRWGLDTDEAEDSA